MLRPWVVAMGLVVACANAPAAQARVQVQTTQVRATPSYLAAVLASLKYTESVEAFETQGGWTRVRTAAGQTGWVNQSALTTRRMTAKAGTATGNTGASSDELALANKGFNSDVEAQFKASHAEVDFAWVDKMGQMKIDQAEITKFVSDGALAPAKGGAR